MPRRWLAIIGLWLAPALAAGTGTGRGTGTGVIEVALSQVGKSDRDAGCPNSGCYGGRQRDWCSEFVSWVYWKSQSPFDGGKTQPWLLADSSKVVAWFRARKGYFERRDPEWKSLTPSAGDYVLIGRVGRNGKLTGRRHSGIVEFEDAEGNLHTIEGNNHGRPVARYVYPAFRTNVSSNGPSNGVIIGIGRRN